MSWFSKALSSVTGADVLGFAGGLLSSNSKNKANSAANAQMIDWERERAKNAHQWEVEDLRKAGLNPILSTGGSGASTSGVSIIPSGESPFASGLNSANSVRLARENIDTIEKQQTGIKYDNDVKYAMAHTALLLNGLLSDSESKGLKISTENPTLNKFYQELENSAKVGQLLDEQIEAQKNDNERSKRIAELYGTDFGYALAALNEIPWLGNIFGMLGSIGGNMVKKPNKFITNHNESGTYRKTEIFNK